jgi:hypothetical protein
MPALRQSAKSGREQLHDNITRSTSSARANGRRGAVTARALAVLRLLTNLNLVGWKIGKSAGFSPLRIRAAYNAAWR